MASTALLFIVDPRRPNVFRYLQKRFQDQPNIHIMWDRRRGERRRASPSAEADRRRSNRRDSPPDFMRHLASSSFPRRKALDRRSETKPGPGDVQVENVGARSVIG